MPALTNPKHERFAQELSKGKTATEAFELSGLEKVICFKPAGFYVYALIDPRNDRVFYVGKGKGRRYAAHHRQFLAGIISNTAKYCRIAEIAASGLRPVAVCLSDGMEEWPAYSLERSFINKIGGDALTNNSVGQMSDLEKAAVSARYGISRIMPFDQWFAKKRRPGSWIISPDEDAKLYHSIVRDFREMANLDARPV